MGTRGVIQVLTTFPAKRSVFLSQQFDGDQLAAVLAHALQRSREFWEYPDALATAIFGQMLLEYGGETAERNIDNLRSLGISPEFGGSDVPVLVVDPNRRLVIRRDTRNRRDEREWLFEHYIVHYPSFKPRGLLARIFDGW